jgi:hypothetical protein
MSPVRYAHPDGALRTIRTGSVGASWGAGGARFNPGDTPAPYVNIGPTTPVGSLTPYAGDYTVTASGTEASPLVINLGLDISGYVSFGNHSWVTLRNFVARGGTDLNFGTGNRWPIVRSWGTGVGRVIEDFELTASNPTYNVYGLHGYDITARRGWIHHVVDGAVLYNRNAHLEAVLLEDSIFYNTDPGQADNKTHNDLVQIQGGTNITLTDVILDSGIGPDVTRTDGMHGANFGVLATQDAYPMNGLTMTRVVCKGNPASHVQMGDSSLGAMAGVAFNTMTFTDSRNANLRMSPETKAAATFTGLLTSTGSALPTSEIEGAVGQR